MKCNCLVGAQIYDRTPFYPHSTMLQKQQDVDQGMVIMLMQMIDKLASVGRVRKKVVIVWEWTGYDKNNVVPVTTWG